MSKLRDEKSNHTITKHLLKKGYVEFEYFGSQFHNEYNGWWLTSETHEEINNIFLGCTLKDAIWMVCKTNIIKTIEK